jgi:2-deoxy-D-gluconate 3-dehydrogenase
VNTWGPFSLDDKIAIVTGGAMGIGFGIAKRMLEAGAKVVLADVDEAALSAAAKRLGASPKQLATIAADIGDDAAPQKIVAFTLAAFDGIDILVNNAGIFPQAPVMEMTPAFYDRVQRINTRGLVFLCKAVAERMIAQKRGGKIVNIGSIDSLHPSMIGLAAYDTSKGAVLMFTKSLALELAQHGIHVNALLPGGVTTEGTSRPLQGSGMTDAQMKAFMDGFIQNKIPLKRMGVPDDIATGVVFLASSASNYMTGAHIVVDGGTLLT